MSWAYIAFLGYLYGTGINSIADRITRNAPLFFNFSTARTFVKQKQSFPFRFIPFLFTVLFVVSPLKFGFEWYFFLFITLTTYFLLLTLYDIRYFLLPNYLTYSLFLIGFLFSHCGLPIQPLITISISSLTLFLFLYGVNLLFYWYRNEYGLGFGDIKLLIALTPWFSPLEILHILILSTSSALIWIIIIWFIKRKTLLKIPFGPFIVFGAWIILIYN